MLRFLVAHVIALFTVVALAAAPKASDPIADVLYDIYKGDQAAFKRAEVLYQHSSDRAELARLATVLAFAPADQVRIAPAMYALYAFQNDQAISVELKSKLAKLAGQALFSQGQFEKASRVFATALALPTLKESDQEYFTYQLAWCDLNQDQHRMAVERMLQWLKKCRACELKKEMIGDLGKAYGEIAFVKGQTPPTHIFALLKTEADRGDFFQGVMMSLKRVQPIRAALITAQLQPTPLFSLWIGALFNSPQFEQIAACEKVTAVKSADPALWPVDAVRKSVLDCARLAYEKVAIPAMDALAVAQTLAHLDPLDLFIQSELLMAVGRAHDSCLVRVRAAVPDSLKLDVYISSVVDICAKAGAADAVAGAAAADPEITSAISGLLMRPMMRASAAQAAADPNDAQSWLTSYLAAIKTHKAWRIGFEKQPLSWLRSYHPSASVIRSMVQDSDWDLKYRLNVWRDVPFDGDMSSVQVLAEDILKSKGANETEDANSYLAFLNEVQGLLPRPSAGIALLKVRGLQAYSDKNVGAAAGWLELYKACVSISDWFSLTSQEQAEVFKPLLTKVSFDVFLTDWPVWNTLLEKNEKLFEAFLAAALATEAFRFKDFARKYSDPHAHAISAAVELKNNPQTVLSPEALAQLDPKWRSDFAAVSTARESAQKIRAIQLRGLDEDQMAVAVEGGLDLVTKSLRQSRARQWTLPAMAVFQQTTLKDALESFRAQLAPSPSYAKIAQLVKRWESRL